MVHTVLLLNYFIPIDIDVMDILILYALEYLTV